MAKTDVILIRNVPGLGGESDQLKVAAGYARNFLFPRGFAIPSTGANQRRLEVLRQRRNQRETQELSSMTELSEALSKLTLVMHVKTGDDGRLFGSVTAGSIADELKHQYDATVDKKKIHLDQPIKAVGAYEVELRLHPKVQTQLKLRLESTNPAVKAAQDQAEAAAAAEAEAAKAPKRERERPARK